MLRQIIIPSTNNHTVILPEVYYGKRVMVIVSELDEKTENLMRADEARKFFNSLQVNMSDFKFDREEAHER